MSRTFEIPLLAGTDQTLEVTFLGIVYKMRLHWNEFSQCWIMDLSDPGTGVPRLRGVPLVTGADLFAQYPEYQFGGSLVVLTFGGGPNSPYDMPTKAGLGIDSHLYYTVP